MLPWSKGPRTTGAVEGSRDWKNGRKKFQMFTPRKINMEHNNGGLEDDFPFQIGDF